MSMIPDVAFSFLETLKELTCSFKTWSVVLHRLPLTSLDADFFKEAVRECALSRDPVMVPQGTPQAYRDALPSTFGIVHAVLEQYGVAQVAGLMGTEESLLKCFFSALAFSPRATESDLRANMIKDVEYAALKLR